MGIKDKFLKWFGDIRFYNRPFFIIFGGNTSYKIKGSHIREILNILKPGDIILRRYDTYLSSLLIPGYWSHVALYVGNGNIIHAVGEGVVEEDILVFTRCDDICILRSDNITEAQCSVSKAKSELNKKTKYDFDFDIKDKDKFYCSEFVAFCYNYPNCLKSKSNYLIPDKFLDCDKFYLVWWARS